MEKNEDFDLAQLVQETQDTIKKEKSHEINLRIRTIFQNIEMWQKELNKTKSQVEKLEKKIANAKDGIQRLKNGDWNYLRSLEQQTQEKQEQKSE